MGFACFACLQGYRLSSSRSPQTDELGFLGVEQQQVLNVTEMMMYMLRPRRRTIGEAGERPGWRSLGAGIACRALLIDIDA